MLRRSMPPTRRNARETAVVRCLRDALLSHGGVSRRRTVRKYRAVTSRHLMPLMFSPLDAGACPKNCLI